MTLHRTAVALALAAQLLGGQQALGLTVELADNAGAEILLLEGEIENGDARRVERAIGNSRRVEEVWLNSNGGSLGEGLKLGRSLRSHGLPALVPSGAICASACVYVLAGAPLRRVAGAGRVGVHMFSMTGNVEMVTAIARLIGKGGPAIAVHIIREIEQASADMAAEQAAFLIEMSVSLQVMTPTTATAHDAIHWLSPAELRRYNLINTE